MYNWTETTKRWIRRTFGRSMRVCYVGLSSPTAYFYDHKRDFTRDQEWHWNPILESPQGLLTLFDEVWFLTRALCPITMRELDFVKFLDEDSDFEQVIKSCLESYRLDQISGKNLDAEENALVEMTTSSDRRIELTSYSNVIEQVFGIGPGKDAPIDNHSAGINIFGNPYVGNSASFNALRVDLFMLKKLRELVKRHSIELLTNRFNENFSFEERFARNSMMISQGVTITRIPVLQLPQGPEITGLDAIRENNFLIDFRKKIRDSAEWEKIEDVNQLIRRIEEEYQRYRNETLVGRQGKARILNSISRNGCRLLLSHLVQGSPQVISLIEDRDARLMSWTAFIASLELSDNSRSSPTVE